MHELPIILVYREHDSVQLPIQMTDGASGFDLAADLKEPVSLESLVPAKIPTGIRLALPKGFEAQIRPRSSMNNRGLIVGFGTSDSDYRGILHVTIVNCTRNTEIIHPGDRIAQVVLAAVPQATWKEVKTIAELGKTKRGSAGFGSTGR